MLHRSAAVLAVVVLSSSLAIADTLRIEHSPVGCVVAGKYPRFEARFTPAEVIAKARVLFQPKDAAHWYAVAMRAQGPAFQGVLPKPKKSLEAFRYYIEATDKTASTARTPDQTATVVASAAECQGKVVAGALGSASVALEVPAGAPTVPVGFASGGVAAAAGAAAAAAAASSAGGGFPTTAVLIGAAGAAAAGGAVVVAKGAGTSDRFFNGTFNGESTEVAVCVSPVRSTCTVVYAFTGTATVRLEESNGSVSGDFMTDGTKTPARILVGSPCTRPTTPITFGCKFTGSAAGFKCESRFEAADFRSTYEFSAALSGGGITGTVTVTASGRSGGVGDCTQMESGSFTVTLR